MNLKEPTKKRNTPNDSYKASLPISSGNNPGIFIDFWGINYSGIFNGVSVIVEDQEEMISLYSKGCFGKGSLSRGLPEFGKAKENIPPMIKERQWARRLKWSKQIDELSECNESLAPQQDCENSPPDDENKNKNDESGELSQDRRKSHDDENILMRDESGSLQKDSENCTSIDDGTDKESKVLEPPVNSSLKRKFNELEECERIESKKVHNSKKNLVEGDGCDSANEKIIGETAHLKLTLNSDDIGHGTELLVVPDSDNETEGDTITASPHLEKEYNVTVMEELHLSLEESFFLSFALGCLDVSDVTGKCLSLESMWMLFQQTHPDFVENYVCYHYFRCKGWVVKPGIKYGGDFVLYKKGPQFYHASYIVLVESVDKHSRNRSGKINRKFTWSYLGGLNRMAESTNKEILLCQVQWPDLEDGELGNPYVLKKFKVNEVLLRRWHPTQEREG